MHMIAHETAIPLTPMAPGTHYTIPTNQFSDGSHEADLCPGTAPDNPEYAKPMLENGPSLGSIAWMLVTPKAVGFSI